MAVAFDAVGSATGFSTTTPSTTPWLTWSHTAGTGGGTVLVGLAWGSTAFPPTISSITYGGNAMTLLGSIATNNTSSNGGVLLYGITGQASGSNTVLVKTSANPTNVMIGNSISFTGAVAFGTAVTNSGNSASATVTVTGTTSGNMVAGVEAHGTNGAVTYTSGTKQFDDEVSAVTGASNLSGGTIAAGGSVALTDTITADVWGFVAVEVQATLPAPPAPPANPVAPGWFPGADRVTAVPGGIPFQQQPPPQTPPPAVITPVFPEAAAYQAPLQPPGWFPGADKVTTGPDGIPFYAQPAPTDATPAVIFPVPEADGIPDWLPLPPNWFPGSQNVTVDPGGIPFFAQPQPLLPALPGPPPPFIAGMAGSGTGAYFTDQYGNPKILRLEQAWALPWNAGRWNGGNWQGDISGYFTSRAAQGMTAWYGTAWADDHVDATCLSGGRTWDGIYPIVINGTPGKIANGTETITLNDPFWQRIDFLFKTALSHGMSCFLNLGMQYDFTGTNNLWFNLSTTQANTFGQLIAARYPQSAYPNVFWFFGDDGSGGQDTYFTQMLAGLQTGGDTRALLSSEQLPETNCHIEFDTGAQFVPGGFSLANGTYNWVYTYDPSYNGVEQSYTEIPPSGRLPVVWGDGVWYGDNSSTQNIADYTIRRFTWWALSSGARGFNDTSGATTGGLVWQWQSGALAAVTNDPNGAFVTSTCGVITTYFTGLTGWHRLIPDTGNQFIVSGRGTKTTNSAPGFNAAKYGDTDNYVSGSITPDGTLAVIYCGQFFNITIDQTKLGAGYTATWVDPATAATQAATPGSTFNSTPLGNNSAGNPDWVLVLQGPPAAASSAPQAPVIPLAPGWFPGADQVTSVPGGVPFARPPADPVGAAAAAATSGPPVYPLQRPVQARQQPLRGGTTIIPRTGVFAQAGPPVKPQQEPVKAQPAVPFLKGRAAARTGTFAQLGPPVKPPQGPVAPQGRGLPPRGRTVSRAGTFAQLGAPVTPPRGPVQAKRLLTRGGHTSSLRGAYAQAGPPVKAPPGPVHAAQPLPQRGRAQSRTGVYTLVVTGSGPPVYPLGHPVRARQLPLQGGRVIRRAGTYAQTGAPVKPLQGPVSAARRPLPSRGRTASQRGPYGQTGPPVIPLRRPVAGQPQKPFLTGRAAWRTGTYTAPLVAPGGTVAVADFPAYTVAVGDQQTQSAVIGDAQLYTVTVGDFQP